MLIIDAGHGGIDPGGGSNSYWKEKDFALDISLYQYERFKELGYPVKMTRTKDISMANADRTRAIRTSGAVYCISNHINAAVSTARGAETIYSINKPATLANKLLDAIVSQGMPKRRSFTRTLPYDDKRDYYFIIRETHPVETVIVEYGFATNAADTALLLRDWKLYAEAVVKAFCEHVGHAYKPKSLNINTQKVKVVVDGKHEHEAYLIDNRSYVPIRFVADALGADVRWDQESKTAHITSRK